MKSRDIESYLSFLRNERFLMKSIEMNLKILALRGKCVIELLQQLNTEQDTLLHITKTRKLLIS